MKISIIGTGYVGLVTGICLAEKGHHVVCVDLDSDKVKTINEGITPIYEEGLDTMLQRNIGKSFSATTDIESAVQKTDISLIAVDTPYDGDKIDLSSIKKAASDVGAVLNKKGSYHVIVVKSTVIPGTTDGDILSILERKSGKKAGTDFGVGMSPEFLREGQAVSDYMNPDRIILGGIDEKTHSMMDKVYSVFEDVEIIKTNCKTAEMIKYTANSLLATLISFSNEIGNLCADIKDVDIIEVMNGVHKDERFSPILPDGSRITPGFISYLAAGCGFGGSCFPKDVKALISYGKERGNSMQLLDSVIKVNKEQPEKIVSILNKHVSELNGAKIAILGLAFKSGTDDIRESPAIPIVKYLLSKGAKVKAYDPIAQTEAKKLFGNHNISYPGTLKEALTDIEAAILLTSWQEFEIVPKILKSARKQPVFIDGRRMLPKNSVQNYEGIGL